MRTIARFTLREALRRRVFTVVAVLSVVCAVLYGLGVWQAFKSVEGFSEGGDELVESQVLAGATLMGLAMFGTLFLGVVLAVFLTLGAVRGDAERGLLQPLLVRPLSRRDLLLGRLIAAGAVCVGYVVLGFTIATVLTGVIGGWWPDRFLAAAAALALAVVIVAALALAGSVVLPTTANGIAVFMVFGAGLVAGLLGQLGDGLGSQTLQDVSKFASWALPFEALYQGALADITTGTAGLTRVVIQLGPLGGAEDAGAGLWLWAIVYLAAVVALATAAFARRDL